MNMRTCKKCNINIDYKHGNAKFCTIQCNRDFFNIPATKETRKCPNCRDKFISKRKDNLYCSRYCADYYSRSLRKEEINLYHRDLYHNNIQRRISTNLRSRLNRALKGAYKAGSAVNELGCTPEELVKHLESQFATNMSWTNYGLYGWHIDHIKPLAGFDLTNIEELKKACHYTNLQPLWAKDNLSKGIK